MLERAKMGIRKARETLERPQAGPQPGVRSVVTSPKIVAAHQAMQAAAKRGSAMAAREIETPAAYRSGGLIAALVVAVVLLGLAWLLNGFATAWGSQPVIRAILGGLNRLLALVGQEPVVVTGAMVWSIGACAHVAISVVERHMWRTKRRIFYFISIPLTFWDLLTASAACLIVLFGSFTDVTVGQVFWAVVAGYLLSVVEIPLVIALSMLWRELR